MRCGVDGSVVARRRRTVAVVGRLGLAGGLAVGRDGPVRGKRPGRGDGAGHEGPEWPGAGPGVLMEDALRVPTGESEGRRPGLGLGVHVRGPTHRWEPPGWKGRADPKSSGETHSTTRVLVDWTGPRPPLPSTAPVTRRGRASLPSYTQSRVSQEHTRAPRCPGEGGRGGGGPRSRGLP